MTPGEATRLVLLPVKKEAVMVMIPYGYKHPDMFRFGRRLDQVRGHSLAKHKIMVDIHSTAKLRMVAKKSYTGERHEKETCAHISFEEQMWSSRRSRRIRKHILDDTNTTSNDSKSCLSGQAGKTKRTCLKSIVPALVLLTLAATALSLATKVTCCRSMALWIMYLCTHPGTIECRNST